VYTKLHRITSQKTNLNSTTVRALSFQPKSYYTSLTEVTDKTVSRYDHSNCTLFKLHESWYGPCDL